MLDAEKLTYDGWTLDNLLSRGVDINHFAEAKNRNSIIKELQR